MSSENVQECKAVSINNQETLDLVRVALKDRKLLRVAECTGLSRNTVQAVAAGKVSPHPSTIKVLADYLGVNNRG